MGLRWVCQGWRRGSVRAGTSGETALSAMCWRVESDDTIGYTFISYFGTPVCRICSSIFIGQSEYSSMFDQLRQAPRSPYCRRELFTPGGRYVGTYLQNVGSQYSHRLTVGCPEVPADGAWPDSRGQRPAVETGVDQHETVV